MDRQIHWSIGLQWSFFTGVSGMERKNCIAMPFYRGFRGCGQISPTTVAFPEDDTENAAALKEKEAVKISDPKDKTES